MSASFDFAKRLSAAIGSSAQKIEEASGGRLKARTVRNWLKGVGGPDPNELVLLAQLTKRDPSWFFSDADTDAAPPGEPDDLVRIPYLDVVVSAGAGRFNDIARALDHQPWPRIMIQQMGNWRRIQCMRASGDSMEPTILDGALVFVERMHEDRVPMRRAKSKRKADIYVVVVGEDARVKRVDQTATGLRLLISDNPEHPPEVYPAGNVKVVGRVVGWLNQPGA